MLYRGFKIERVILHCNESRLEYDDDIVVRFCPANRVNYVISTLVGGQHWVDMACVNSNETAMSAIDHWLTMRASA